jgi:hypothetical protein
METETQHAGSLAPVPKSVTVLGSIEIVYRAVSEDTGGVYSVFENKMPLLRERPLAVDIGSTLSPFTARYVFHRELEQASIYAIIVTS